MPPVHCPLCREDVSNWYWKRMYVDWLQDVPWHPHCTDLETDELVKRAAAMRLELRDLLSFVHRDFFPSMWQTHDPNAPDA